MHAEARVAIQPSLDLWVFVRCVVVRNEVDLFGLGSEIISHAEEFLTIPDADDGRRTC
jgi:hypothetical protein